jgi:hypothetical protein
MYNEILESGQYREFVTGNKLNEKDPLACLSGGSRDEPVVGWCR